jgi:uracil phosphoribosyltransferase
MSIFVLSQNPSIALQYLYELRHKDIQQDRLRFRYNLQRLGEILAYEISKTFAYPTQKIDTPLASIAAPKLEQVPILLPILRAGLPFYEGFARFFDGADSGFVGAYRQAHQADLSFDIDLLYATLPPLEGRTLILIDPMLATGKSLFKVYQALEKFGKPAHLHIAAVIASQEGADFISRQIPQASLWTVGLDPYLNDHAYIVPGLGDAGDLAFGTKI